MGYTFSPFGEEVRMPWKECSVMDERLQFVARRLNGEPMARNVEAQLVFLLTYNGLANQLRPAPVAWNQ
jgi:hypothetical protein